MEKDVFVELKYIIIIYLVTIDIILVDHLLNRTQLLLIRDEKLNTYFITRL